MNPRTFIKRIFRFTAVAAVVATLPACQKARMSSVDRTSRTTPTTTTPTTTTPTTPGQPGVPVRPITPPGGVIPPGVNPGVPVRPITPPGVIPGTPINPGVQPPRVIPGTPVNPGVFPPGGGNPPGVIPGTPMIPGGGGNPNVPYIPPNIPSQPNPVVPPRVTPPGVNPNNPGVTIPGVPTTPTIPSTPSEPTVTPLTPTNPTNPVYPTNPGTVTPSPYIPATTTPPGMPSIIPQTPSYVAPLPASGGGYVVGGGQGAAINVGGMGGAVVSTSTYSAVAMGSGSAGYLVGHKGYAEVPVDRTLISTPIRSEILSTCHGPCDDRNVVFVPGEPPKKAEFTCLPAPLPTQPYTNKLDILFVIDTSASMREERVAIARQMARFINELSPDVDYRIAVMLGHGPRSKATNVSVGELFTPPNKSDQYSVIQLDDLNIAKHVQNNADERVKNGRSANTGSTGAELTARTRQETAAIAADRLVEMMMKAPNDASEAQGEAGLLNLYMAVSDSRKLAEMQRRGFWRTSAAKTVVYVADENDVCFDYAEASRVSGKTIKGHYATESDRRAETDAFNRTDVCAATANGQRLTPKLVFEAVERSSEMPVIFTGILYLDNNSIPKKTDKYSKDNEMGHGYLDVIALGLGKAADLGQGNFGTTLAKLGDFSNFKMKYPSDFAMQGVTDVNDIDPKSLVVTINDASGEKYVFSATNVKLEIDAKSNKARVIIAYEIMAQVYGEGRVRQGATIGFKWTSKSGKQPTAQQAANNDLRDGARPAEVDAKGNRLAPVEDRIKRANAEDQNEYNRQQTPNGAAAASNKSTTAPAASKGESANDRMRREAAELTKSMGGN